MGFNLGFKGLNFCRKLVSVISADKLVSVDVKLFFFAYKSEFFSEYLTTIKQFKMNFKTKCVNVITCLYAKVLDIIQWVHKTT